MKLSSALITAIAALITTSASAQEIFSSGPINLPISDGLTTSHTIFGGQFDRYLADVNVRLNLTHTFDSDLDIVLVAPNNFGYVHLCSDVGGAGAAEALLRASLVGDADLATALAGHVEHPH